MKKKNLLFTVNNSDNNDQKPWKIRIIKKTLDAQAINAQTEINTIKTE